MLWLGMPILPILLVLIVVGAALYLVNAVVPMDARFKTALNVIVIVAMVIWLLQRFAGYLHF